MKTKNLNKFIGVVPSIASFCSKFNQAVQKSNESFVFPVTQFLQPLLFFLLKEQYVKDLVLEKSVTLPDKAFAGSDSFTGVQLVRVYPRYRYQGIPVVKSVVCRVHTRYTTFLTCAAFRTFQSANTFTLVSTTHGVVSMERAVEIGLGGRILLSVTLY